MCLEINFLISVPHSCLQHSSDKHLITLSEMTKKFLVLLFLIT